MKFQYQLGADDYGAFARHLARPGGDAAKRLRVARLAVPAIMLLLLLPELLQGNGIPGLQWLFVVFAIAWYLYFPVWFARQLEMRIRATATSGMPRGAVGTHVMQVDEGGITTTTPFGSIHRHWNGVEGLVEEPDHLFVMIGRTTAFVVPKSSMGESVGELRDLINRAKAEPPAA